MTRPNEISEDSIKIFNLQCGLYSSADCFWDFTVLPLNKFSKICNYFFKTIPQWSPPLSGLCLERQKYTIKRMSWTFSHFLNKHVYLLFSDLLSYVFGIIKMPTNVFYYSFVVTRLSVFVCCWIINSKYSIYF